MNALLVGGDSLGSIPDVLEDYNIRITRHITGRNTVHQRRVALPKDTEVLILLTDYLGHNAMRHYRDTASASGIPIVVCKRSAVSIEARLQSTGWQKNQRLQ